MNAPTAKFRPGMPFNIEAENQLLGGILINNDLMSSVAGKLEPEHFGVPANAEIYRVCKELVATGRVASPVSLKPMLDAAVFESREPIPYLMSLIRDPASALVANDYADQLVDLSIRRSIMQSAEEIIYNAGEGSSVSTPSLIEDLEQVLTNLRGAARSYDDTPQDIAGITDHCLQRILDIREGEIEPSPSTGLRDLDKKIGGYDKGCFVIIGGRPGQGKTIFGVDSMRKVVRQKRKDGRNYGAIYFSLEVPYRDIWNRLVSTETRQDHAGPIPYTEIRRAKSLRDEQFERIANHGQSLKRFPMSVIDTPGLSVAQIEARARMEKQRREKEGGTLDVVFIDHLGLIRASDRYRGSKVQEIAEISGCLLAMAKRLDVCVVSLCQLSRNVENRENKLPSMADLRDSGAIEQDANAIIFLYRPAYYEQKDNPGLPASEPHKLVVNVDKSRDGSTGVFEAFVDVETNYITDGAN